MQEKTVQNRAIAFLENYYRRRWWRRKVFAAAEVRTKRKYGGKRADGLLVFQGWLTGKPYVVSIEAKSKKTLPAIKPYHDQKRWWCNCLRFGFFMGLGTGLIFLGFYANDLTTFLLVLVWSLLAGMAYGLLTWNSNRHKTIDVIDQVRHYPANEQWLTFSTDAFEALMPKQQKALRQISRNYGVGLLLIGKNKHKQILHRPSGRWYWFWDARFGGKWIGDFLVYYSREEEIRGVI